MSEWYIFENKGYQFERWKKKLEHFDRKIHVAVYSHVFVCNIEHPNDHKLIETNYQYEELEAAPAVSFWTF